MTEERNILQFDNLVYEVKNKDKEIKTEYARIIDGLTGIIESGKITAVMGASGCGKTHFFELLIGNLSSNCKTSGTITYNNEERDWETWTEKIAFLPQDDIYYPELTPYETIMYNLSFNLNLSIKEKDALARQALEASAIFNKRDAPIKSLSGGERKRAMIAITLVNDPEILILDEPTTGLDSNSSLNIVSSLKDYAEKNNKIVIMTVHQPGEGLFNMFGDLLFLTKRGSFYQGAVKQIVPFLKENNIEIPEHVSLAEFLFLLHSDERHSIVDTFKYKRTIEDIVERNAVNTPGIPESCNNNKVFRLSLNIQHSYLLLKHNLNLLIKGSNIFRTILYFCCFPSFFYFFSYMYWKNWYVDAFTRIDLPSAVSEFTFRQKSVVAYSLFTNFFIKQVCFYTSLFSLNMQGRDLFELEIFTGKYSVLSHYLYNYCQKFLVSIFFITIDFLFISLLNKKGVIPMGIMALTYAFILMFLGLTLLTNTLITAIPMGPKMETFFLLWNNFLVYYPNPYMLAFFRGAMKAVFEPIVHLLNTIFIFPNVCYDLIMNILTRTEFINVRGSDSPLDKILKYLKYSNVFLPDNMKSIDPRLYYYMFDPEWALGICTLKITLNQLKIIAALATLNSVVLSIFLVWYFKVPNIRLKLQK